MKHSFLLTLILVFSILASFATEKETKIPQLNLSNLKKVAEVDIRYQSVNVEMCEVVGGDFWIPYDLLDPEKVESGGFAALKRKISPVNLYDKKLRTLATALGPMYIRVSGTWANTTYFQDNDEPKLESAPKGYENVLTRAEWKGVIDFCKATDSKLVTSFAISNGMRDEDGNWTPEQAKPLINYTKSIGGEIAAAEMFNEVTYSVLGGTPEGYDAVWFARDYSAFKEFVHSAVPEMKILGPSSVGEGPVSLSDGMDAPVDVMSGTISTEDIFNTDPMPEFDLFSYHFYGSVSRRCGGGLNQEDALSKEWLSKTEGGLKYYAELCNKYMPGAPIWLTETAEAACGGDPLAATYVDCFRYLEQLGRLAKKNVQVVMHNTLCASEYALLEQDTYKPRPNYWAALLWNKLMGTKVYDAGIESSDIDVFVHDLKNSSDGYVVLIVNPTSIGSSIEIPANAEQYLLTADGENLQTKSVKLNGEKLQLKSDDSLPKIEAQKIKAGEVKIPAYSILFLTFKNNK